MRVALILVMRWLRGLVRNIFLCVAGSTRGVLTLVSSFGCSICRSLEVVDVCLVLGVSVARVGKEE